MLDCMSVLAFFRGSSGSVFRIHPAHHVVTRVSYRVCRSIHTSQTTPWMPKRVPSKSTAFGK